MSGMSPRIGIGIARNRSGELSVSALGVST